MPSSGCFLDQFCLLLSWELGDQSSGPISATKTVCVTLGKSLNLTESQFLHLSNGSNYPCPTFATLNRGVMKIKGDVCVCVCVCWGGGGANSKAWDKYQGLCLPTAMFEGLMQVTW